MDAKLIKFKSEYELYDGNEMIGSTYPYQNIPLLSLKNCQAIERGYDLDELAYDFSWNYQSDPNYGDTINIFKEGFQKALEILGDKNFSEEDVLKVVTHILNELVLVDGFDKQYLFPESIYQETTTKCKSLQQKEWDVEIEMEYIGECNGNNDNGCFQNSPGHDCGCFKREPKLDENGCLILKRK